MTKYDIDSVVSPVKPFVTRFHNNLSYYAGTNNDSTKNTEHLSM